MKNGIKGNEVELIHTEEDLKSETAFEPSMNKLNRS